MTLALRCAPSKPMPSPRYTLGPTPTLLGIPGEDEQRAASRPHAAAPAVAEEPVVPVAVEAILDPAGQVVEIDGRVLSERLMFSFGYTGSTFQEIAEEFAASVLWVEVAVRQNPWLEEARVSGVAARDRDRVLRAERGYDKLIDGHTIVKQKIDKMGDVHDLEEEVSPNGEAIKKVLETRARDRYGKDSRPVEVHITMDAFSAAQARAAGAIRVEHKEVQDG